MLKVLGGAPKDVGIRNVSLWKVRIELQSTPTMKLSLFQPSPAGVEPKMLAGVNVRESRMGKSKFRVMLNGLGELAYGPVQSSWILRIAVPQPLQETIIRRRIRAKASADSFSSTAKFACKRSGHAASNLVLNVENIFRGEYEYIREGDLPRLRVEQLE